MQTTLLGLAISFIVALLTALIGPYFVDWNQFRPQFEAEATRILGTQVRVAGAMDARLLPVPSLRLQSVALGGANEAGRLSAERFDVEFSLGALMRGEVRASEVTVNGISLDLGLDEKGQIDWPAIGNVDARALAIEKLSLTGRMALHDAASKKTLELQDIAFAGDVRGAAGSLRGDGNFTLTGTRYPFRLNINAQPDQPGSRVRLTIDAGAVPLLVEAEGVVTAEVRRPRFEGSLVLVRPQRPNSNDPLPLRLAAKLKADPSGAVFDQIDFSAGADETSLKLSGRGDMRFGALPFLRATLDAKSLDGEKILANGGPVATLLPWLAESLAALPQIPFAADVTTSIEQIMLAGRPLQDIGIELRTAGSGWSVSKLEFRGPGATRVALAGAFGAAQASGFDGRISLISTDPDAFSNWLQGRGDGAIQMRKPLKIGGQMKLAPGRILLDSMVAEIDGSAVRGRLMLARPEGAPSRIEATLQADRLDIDAAISMLTSFNAGRGGWPDQAQIVLDIAQASAGGQELKPFGISLQYDARHITLERLRIGDANGITLDGSGTFDRTSGTGTLMVSAAAPSLARLAVFAEPALPQLSPRIGSLGREDGPAKLSLSLGLEGDTAKPDSSKLKGSFAIEAAALSGAVTLNATARTTDIRGFDLDKLKQISFALDAKLNAPRGRTFAVVMGFADMVAVGDAPLAFELAANGNWASGWRGSAKLTGPSLDADVQGIAEPWAQPRAASLRLAIRRANIAPLLGIASDDPLAHVTSLTMKMTVHGDSYTFDGIDGTIAGAHLRGRSTITLQDVNEVDGEIGIDKLELVPIFAVAIGGSGREADTPIGAGWIRGWRGKIGFVALRGILPAGTELQSLSGSIRNDGAGLRLDDLKAKLGGGEATADVDARSGVAGLMLTGRLQLSNADGGALGYRGLAIPAAKVSLQLTLASQGRSTTALLSAIAGEGTATLSAARLPGLNPKSLEIAVNASEQAKVGDDTALRRIVEPALAAAPFTTAAAQIPFVIKDGRLRVTVTPLDSAEARLVVSGGYDFTADQADWRATLTALNLKGVGNSQPELQVFAVGPPDRMTRAVDVGPLSSWLAIRAIDRETRRLDALERGTAPSVAAVPPVTPSPPAPKMQTAPGDAPDATAAAPLSQPVLPSGAQIAPALPPAIEIGPPPGTPRQRPRTAPRPAL